MRIYLKLVFSATVAFCAAVVPTVGQPYIIGIQDRAVVERVDLATGESEAILTGNYLYSLALDPATNDLYVGGLDVLRVGPDRTIVDTVLTHDVFRDLHGWRGGTPCEHTGIALDLSESLRGVALGLYERKYYASGRCFGGPHLIRANLDGERLEYIDGVFGLDVAVDHRTEDHSVVYVADHSGYICRHGASFWQEEKLVESNARQLELDLVSEKMYWRMDRSTRADSIFRANLDGSVVEYLANGISFALDVAGGSLYFSRDSLYRSNMDGSDPVAVSDRTYAEMVFQGATGTPVTEAPPTPSGYELFQNYPNPFNPTTSISYDLPEPAEATLSVFDLLGRQIRVLASGTQPAGSHEVSFDATGLPSGVYIYRLEGGGFVETRRMVVVR